MKKLFTILIAVLSFTSLQKIYAQDVITLGVSDSIGSTLKNYAGSSSNVTIVIPTGYTCPEFAGGKKLDLTALSAGITDITIKGDGASQVILNTKQIEFPTRVINSLTMKNLKLSGLDELANPVGSNYTTMMGNYIVNSTTAINVTNLSFIDCSIANYRGVIRLQSSTPTLSNISFDNCVIRNIGYGTGGYCLINPIAGSTIKTVSVKNCTIYSFFSNFLPLSNVATTVTSVIIDKCTFDQMMLGGTGKYLVDFGSTAVTTSSLSISVTNSLFGRVAITNKGIRAGATGNTAVTNYNNNYATTDWVLSSNVFTVNAYSGTVSNLFTTPTTVDLTNYSATVGNYSILDKSFVGLGAAGATTAVNIPFVSGTITFNGREITLSEVSNLNVFSVTGELLKSAEKTNCMSVTDLPKGLYIVKTGSAVQKILNK